MDNRKQHKIYLVEQDLRKLENGVNLEHKQEATNKGNEMYTIVDTKSGKNLTEYNTGNRAEFTNYDEAKVVLDSINRYTNVQYIIVNMAQANK